MKKIISVLLAIVMAVSTLPFTVLSASAAEENGLVAEYLTGDLTTNGVSGGTNLTVKNSSGLSWDSTVGAAKFEGSSSVKPYLSVPFSSLLGETTWQEGFTVSFYGMAGDSSAINADTWQRYWELTSNEGFGNGDTSTYLFHSPNGRIKTNLPNPSKHETDIVDYQGDAICNANIWHHFVLTYSNASFILYVDGIQFGNTVTNESEYGSAWWNAMKQGNLLIGGSSYSNDPGFNGYIKSFRVFNKAVVPSLEDRAYSGMRSFAYTMDGTKFTGMGDAYKYYTYLSAAFDAFHYGHKGVTLDDLRAKLRNLNKYKNQMTVWNGFTRQTFADDYIDYGSLVNDNTSNWESGEDYSTYNKNVLYGEKSIDVKASVTAQASGGTGNNSNVVNSFMYPQMTLLYDGRKDILKTPVLVRFYATSTTPRYAHFASSEESKLALASSSVWYGVDTSWNWVWLYSKKISNDIGQIGTTASNGKAAQISNNKAFNTWSKKNYTWANMFVLNEDFAEGEYLKEIVPVVKCYTSSGTSVRTDDIVATLKNDQAPIRYINYKALMDAGDKLNNLKLKDVSAYREGGLTAYFEKLDKCINDISSFDVTSYFDSTAGENQYTQCANAIQAICENVNALDNLAGNAKADGYQSLRDAFDYSDTVAEDVYTGTVKALGDESMADDAYNPGFEAESWNTFKTAYNNAVASMKDVNDGNINYNDAAGAAANAEALKTAFLALEKSTLFVDAPTIEAVGDYKAILTEGETVQIINNDFADATKVTYTIKYEDGFTVSTTDYTEPIDVFGTHKASYADVTATARNSEINLSSSETARFYSIYAPTVTCQNVQEIDSKKIFGYNDKIIIKHNSAKMADSALSYTLNGVETVVGSAGGNEIELTPNADALVSAKVTRTAKRETRELTVPEVQYYYLVSPEFSEADGAKIAADTAVTINADGDVKLEYSYDGENWTEYTAPVVPFTDNTDKFVVTLYARVTNEHSGLSRIDSIDLFRNESFDLYAVNDGQIDSFYYTETGTIRVSDTYKYSSEIYYMVTADGVADPQIYTYNTFYGIKGSDFADKGTVTITAFAKGSGEVTTKVAERTFVNKNHDDFIYHESFDGAKIDGTALKTGSKKGLDGTIAASGASIVTGAGNKNESGDSTDWRNNVLKLDQGSNSAITLTKNPLASFENAPFAREKGVTISFWRHLTESTEPKNHTSSGIVNEGNGGFTPSITFQSSNAAKEYACITATAFTCLSNGAVDGDSSKNDYVDIKPDNQDNTQHEVGNSSGYWVNVVVTIDPNKGIKIYTNGKEHNVNVTVGDSTGSYKSGDGAESARFLLNFLTKEDTNFAIANGVGYWGLNTDQFIDDVRLYTKPLRQVDIWNDIYNGEDADIKTSTSTSHDPTNVTVYTLASNGKQVGQEYIDYNKIDVTDKSVVSKIDYYSFGTGMTIYHSTDNEHWTCVGDSEGRFGYSNQDLFGAEYHTALATPLQYAAGDSRAGAGHLQWAPHVMYNLTLDTWVYYGSTSSWGSQTSAIFYCVSTDGTPLHYEYKGEIYHSTAHPNAIDACVFYEYDKTTNKPIPSSLKSIFGSWGGTNAIAAKNLYADGSATDITSHNGIICNGIDSNLEGASDGGSGEGGYVVYRNGYYYLYVSFGQNTGSYVERVFRSTEPYGPYVDGDGTSATDTSTQTTHGNQLIGSFDSSLYDYLYVSTGHNSAYKVVSDNGEINEINALHARPLATEKHGFVALPDAALATRQSEVTGNVTLHNQIAYTESGWPVLMPNQYNSKDTVTENITAAELEGIYNADDMQLTEYYNSAAEYSFSILADTDTTAIMYGSRANGQTFNYDLKISEGADGTNYFTLYNGTEKVIEGVIGKHWNAEKGEYIIQFGAFNVNTTLQTWAYRVGDMPSVDQESAGDIVSHSGVIYTHRADESYAKYGQRISDDELYRTSQEHQGERCTTITTDYPYIIDTNNAGSITAMRNEEFARAGYTGSDIRARDVYGSWVDGDGNVLTDAQAKENADNGLTVKRVYVLYGYVSNYFHYHEDGDSVDSGNTSALTQQLEKNHYTESGVQLVIRYQNKDTGESYGEYEFFFVEPNPANAHSIVAIRDQDQNMHGAASMFTGFDSSYGNVVTAEGSNSAGKYMSKLTNNGNNNIIDNDHRSAGITSTDANGNKAISYGIGVFNHLGDWGSAGSLTNDPDGTKGYTTGGDNSGYNEPARIRDSFNFFAENMGTNAGAYSLVEYYGMGRNSDGYAVAAADLASYVVDADYYIDYSNEDLYDFDRNGDNLVTVNAQGRPTGYKLNFFVNNINWNPKNERNVKAATNYCRNDTGLTANASVVKSTNSHLVANTSTYHTDKITANSTQHNGNDNKYSLSWNSEEYGRRAMSSDYKLASSDNGWINGLWSPFPTVDNGFGNTGDWRGEIYLTGKGFQNISKKHDNNDVTATTYAEDNSNFVFEKGVNYHLNSVGVDYYAIQQAYSYYNVGVNTCDKGAVREFVENYCNKQMNITRDANGKITSIRPVYDNNGNPMDIKSGKYSVASYQEYLDALAEAYWFMENAKNTTYSSYVDADGNTVNCDETSYSTAYGVTADGKEHALIYADDVADDIFGNSGVSTDPVQAKLIADVIEAYENLFTEQDYTNAETQYNDAKQAIADLLADAEGNYTSTSKEAWDNFAEGINDYFTYYLNRDEPVENQEYWRYVELTGSEYRELEEAIQVMKTTLMPVVETEPLEATISSKKQDLTNGIGTKSFASWEALYNEAVSAQELIAQKDVEDEHGFLPGKYAVTGTGSYTYGGKEYKYQTFDANDDSLSTLQTNINSENGVLAAKELEGIDETEAYQAYDSIYAVMQNVDWNKYDPQYVDEIKATLADTYDEVYTKLTAEQAQTVNDFFGTTVVNADQAYGRTALQKTDPITATLMTYNTVVNDEQKSKYVKQFDAVFTSTTTDASGNETTSAPTVQSKYYGEAFTFTEPTVTAGQYVKWTLTNYDYGVDINADLSGVAPNGSTKVKTTSSTFDRIADANIVVQAKVLGGSTENTIPVYIYNAYGRVVEIKYVTDSNYQASENGVKADEIPFYNFSVWKNYKQKDSEGNVTSIHIYPSYTPAETCNLSTTDGTISNTVAEFNTKVTLDGSSVENFYAWASEVNGTYSVASYNPVYEFYAYGSEDFTPITKDADGYKIGGAPIDPETFVVDTTFNYGDYKTDYTNLDSAKMTKLDFIESKLDNKYPFIQIISKSNHVDENGVTKYYAYCRITDGAVNRTGCTITMNNGTSEFTGNVTKILSNGQFYVSTKSNVSFKANISYDYNLAFNGSNTDNNAQTTLISVTDSSAAV